MPMVSRCVTWVQFNGPPKFLFGRIKIPIEAIEAECKRVVGFAERAVQFQSFNCCGLCLGERLLGSHDRILPVPQQSIRVSQTGICLGIFRVLLDCLIEESEGSLQTIGRSLIPEVAPFEIGLVCLRINNSYGLQGSLLLRIYADPNLICDGSSHLVLERQGIPQLTLITLGP